MVDSITKPKKFFVVGGKSPTAATVSRPTAAFHDNALHKNIVVRDLLRFKISPNMAGLISVRMRAELNTPEAVLKAMGATDDYMNKDRKSHRVDLMVEALNVAHGKEFHDDPRLDGIKLYGFLKEKEFTPISSEQGAFVLVEKGPEKFLRVRVRPEDVASIMKEFSDKQKLAAFVHSYSELPHHEYLCGLVWKALVGRLGTIFDTKDELDLSHAKTSVPEQDWPALQKALDRHIRKYYDKEEEGFKKQEAWERSPAGRMALKQKEKDRIAARAKRAKENEPERLLREQMRLEKEKMRSVLASRKPEAITPMPIAPKVEAPKAAVEVPKKPKFSLLGLAKGILRKIWRS
jgi:hypothetical protein